MSAFNNATLLITGGTGSFGHTVLKHFLTSDIGEIRIFSRDEKKQDDMRHGSKEGKILHWKCERSPVGTRCHGWSGLYLSCCSAEAGTVLRILSHGSRPDKCGRDK